jgi:hypothetical protein
MESTVKIIKEMNDLTSVLETIKNLIEIHGEKEIIKEYERQFPNFLNYFNDKCSDIFNGKSSIEDLKKTVNNFHLKMINDITEIDNFKINNHNELFLNLVLKNKVKSRFIRPFLIKDEEKFMLNPANLSIEIENRDEIYWFKKNVLFRVNSSYEKYKSEEHLINHFNDKDSLSSDYTPVKMAMHPHFGHILKMLEKYQIKNYIYTPNYNHKKYKEFCRNKDSFPEKMIVSENEFFFNFPEMLKYKEILVPYTMRNKNQILLFNIHNEQLKYITLSNKKELDSKGIVENHMKFLIQKIDKILLKRRINDSE